MLLNGPLQTNFSGIWIKIDQFSFKEINLKMLSAKCELFCSGLNLLILNIRGPHYCDLTRSISWLLMHCLLALRYRTKCQFRFRFHWNLFAGGHLTTLVQAPGRRQAIIWTNAGILLIRTLGTNFSEILCKINSFSFSKMHLKMASAKWHLFGAETKWRPISWQHS